MSGVQKLGDFGETLGSAEGGGGGGGGADSVYSLIWGCTVSGDAFVCRFVAGVFICY